MVARIAAVLLMCVAWVAQAAEPPRVVASIAPIHSLVAGVMEGVASPELLVSSAASPHSYLMTPSDMRALQRADLVVWVGENVESFLPKSLRNLPNSVVVLKLMALPEVTRLPSRHGGRWQGHDHHHEHEEVSGETAGLDGHLWLDPRNAQAVVQAVVAELVRIDPANADQYRQNGQRLAARLAALDQSLERMLIPLRDQPFVVFHDAYHYLEARYDLNAVGAISIDPERKPGAKRLREIRQMIVAEGVVCIFSEPQFPRSIVKTLSEGLSVGTAELDPTGTGMRPGTDMYFTLMELNAKHLVQCLSP